VPDASVFPSGLKAMPADAVRVRLELACRSCLRVRVTVPEAAAILRRRCLRSRRSFPSRLIRDRVADIGRSGVFVDRILQGAPDLLARPDVPERVRPSKPVDASKRPRLAERDGSR
jgi:hypothetical protein